VGEEKEPEISTNETNWSHCSSYGTLLIHIAANPHSTIDEIADALSLTHRSVWGTIGALRAVGQVSVVRIGRKHHYYVNPDALLRHPTVKGVRMGDLLAALTPEPQTTMGMAN
jgi:hypothetical protein